MVRSLEGKHSRYFEGILQIRNINEAVVAFVEKDLGEGHIAVSDVRKVKNGKDYFISDNDYTRAIGKRLQQKFGGQLIYSSSLHTQVKGKDAYRLTALFRLPGFSKGDTVNYGGDIFRVKAMGKDIVLIGIGKNTKKLHLKYRDMRQIKKVEFIY